MIHKFGIPSTDLNRADRFWVEDTVDATTDDVIDALAAHDTVSGSIVAITDGGKDLPIRDLTVEIADTDGVTECNIYHCGKNLFNKNNYASYKGYFSTGTSTVTYNSSHTMVYIKCKPNTTYTVSRLRTVASERLGVSYTDVQTVDYGIATYGGILAQNSGTVGDKMSLTITTNADATYLLIWAWWNSSVNAADSLQIEVGSTATDYEAYITPTTYTIDLGTTVTAGTLDVTTGDLAVTAPTAGTYTIDAVEITTLKGGNTFWADCGDVTVDYRADTTLYIAKLTGSTEDDMVADANISSGDYFMVGNTLYLATAAIAANATIIPGTNCTATNLAEALNAIN